MLLILWIFIHALWICPHMAIPCGAVRRCGWYCTQGIVRSSRELNELDQPCMMQTLKHLM